MIYFDVTKFKLSKYGWIKDRKLRKFDNRKKAVEYAKKKCNCIVGVNHPMHAGMIWAFDEYVKQANESRAKIGNKPDFRESLCRGYLYALRSYKYFFA